MSTYRSVLAALLSMLLGLLACTGCSSGGSMPTDAANVQRSAQQPVAAPWQLPSPGALAKLVTPPRQSSYVDGDLVLKGKLYEATLPHQLVVADGDNAKLSPNWTAGSPLSDLAFGIYHFQVPGYDRNDVVRLTFDGTLPAAGDIWLGLSRWTGDHWDWFGGADSSVAGQTATVDAGQLDPYFGFSGDLLAVVALTGTQAASLASIRLGGLPPVAAISATPDTGPVPVIVNFDASGSSTPEGTITRYDWDFDGDGTYDQNTGTNTTTSYQYMTNGTFHPVVKVTNSNGVYSTATTTVYAVGDWQHTWGRSNSDELNHVVVSGNGMIYAAGDSAKPDVALNYDLLLTKWTPTGDLVWAKCWDSGGNDFADDILVDGAGHIYTVGSSESGVNSDVLVIKWDLDGNVIWARTFGGNLQEAGEKEVYDSNNSALYVGGNTDSFNSSGDIFVAKLDAQGGLTWSYYSDEGDVDRFGDLRLEKVLFNTYGVAMVADYKTGTNFNIRLLTVGLDGTLQTNREMSDTSAPKSDPRLLVSFNLAPLKFQYFVSGFYDYGAGAKAFLSKVGESGPPAYTYSYDVGPFEDVADMVFDAAGNIVIGGWQFSSNSTGEFFAVDPENGVESIPEIWYGTNNDSRFSGIASFQSGILCAGSSLDDSPAFQQGGSSNGQPSVTFNDASTTYTSTGWNWDQINGAVTDETANGVLDNGGGGVDSLLLFKERY